MTTRPQTKKRFPQQTPKFRTDKLLGRPEIAKKDPQEINYYGLHACKAIFQHRPETIIRAYITKDLMGDLTSLMKFCAENKLAYHIVTQEDLAKITGSVHHEGVSLLARRKPALNQKSLEAQLQRAERACYLYLDGVGNPHNIGALLRTAAHFGLSALIGLEGEMPPLNPSGCRIAEGGAEFVPVGFLHSRKDFFDSARKAGFRIFGTSSHRGTNLFSAKFPAKTIIALGAEIEGMDPLTEQECDEIISIKGTGQVESLNVSVAGGLLLSEYFRGWAP